MPSNQPLSSAPSFSRLIHQTGGFLNKFVFGLAVIRADYAGPGSGRELDDLEASALELARSLHELSSERSQGSVIRIEEFISRLGGWLDRLDCDALDRDGRETAAAIKAGAKALAEAMGRPPGSGGREG